MSRISTSSRLGDVKEYYFSRKLKEIAQLRAEGNRILNLGIGSPDLAPPQNVLDALKSDMNEELAHKYQSYVGIPELRQAWADFYQKWYQVDLNPANEILPLMGSKEGIMHISMTYVEPGEKVLVPNPGYPTYQSASRLAGGIVKPYNLDVANHWLPNLVELAKEDLSDVKLMWVNYPHMPTGALATKKFFEELIEFAQAHQILVINDNPYSFILNNDYLSILSIPGAKEIALELNSLSKSHNMAGWRLGMLAGNAELVQNVLRFKSNMDSGMFRPIQKAAVAALQQPDSWYQLLNDIYQIRQQKAKKIFDLLDCQYNPKQKGMFVWGKIPLGMKDAYLYSDELLKHSGVFITPGGIFGTQGDQYLRISLCNTVEIFEEAFDKIVQQKELIVK